MNLDLSEHLQRLVAAGGYETGVSDVVSRFVRPGDTVIDVGANVGYHALHWAKQVGRAGRILAFEPVPPNVEALRRNVSLNPGLSVEVYELGLGDRPGSVELNHERRGATSGGYSALHANGSGYSVPVETLDDFLRRNNIEALRLLKLDVEGWEYKVLAGALRTLEIHRPYVMFEWQRGFVGQGQTELGSLIETLDYAAPKLIERSSLGKGYLIQLPHDSALWPQSGEILLCPSYN